MDNRQMFRALAAAFAVYFLYIWVYRAYFAPPPASPSITPETANIVASSPTTGAASAPATQSSGLKFTEGASSAPLTIGGGGDDHLRLTLSPDGASLASIELTERSGDRYRRRQDARGNEPYRLLLPLNGPDGQINSFESARVWLPDRQQDPWVLRDVPWSVVEQSPRSATFETRLVDATGAPLVVARKSYRFAANSSLIDIDFSIENVSGAELRIGAEQTGPIGIHDESSTYDMRLLMAAWANSSALSYKTFHRNALARGEQRLVPAEQQAAFRWLALTNRFFAICVRPRAATDVEALGALVGETALPPSDARIPPGDLRSRWITKVASVAPGAKMSLDLQVYAGSKAFTDFRAASPDFVDRSKIGFDAVKDADNSCFCSFPWLTGLMTWLLETIHVVIPNYGVAIILLVILVRTMLHPLAVFQQKSMFRAQESMSRIQPRLAEIRERYANDRVRQNQETMKVYADEQVNPMAPMVGMIPMMIQMPIMIALWTALNTDINLRHSQFDGWWIRDLAAPDSLITFASPVTVPVLGWLPLIGRIFHDIPSFNLLPILMGVSMYLQQKYMPKPNIAAKREAAKAAGGEQSDAMGMTPDEQIRQQQMIANMMSVMMPVMLYYFPSGLALYWMSSNIFGIFESLIVRKQLDQEKARRAAAPPQPAKPAKPGWFANMMKQMAEHIEDVQRKADDVSRSDPKTTQRERKDKKRK